MKKVLIICGSNFRLCPYLFLYINSFISQEVQLHIAYWDRDGLADITLDNRITIHKFTYIIDDSIMKLRKINAFVQFKSFVNKVNNSIKSDYIVCLDTQFAVLLKGLLKHYKGKYIYDMRDPSYEFIPSYKMILKRIISDSYCCIISSNGYRDILPYSNKIYLTHNINKFDSLNEINIKNNNSIVVSYWGIIRDLNVNKKIIDLFGKDKRFYLNYYGTISNSANRLVDYVKKNGYENINFYGKYFPQEKDDFANKTDMILSFYSSSFNYKYSMANKFYDSLIYKKPIICNEKTYQGELVKKNYLGISLNLSNNFTNEIYNYYQEFDSKKFSIECEKMLNKCIAEYNDSISLIKKMI